MPVPENYSFEHLGQGREENYWPVTTGQAVVFAGLGYGYYYYFFPDFWEISYS